MKQASATTHYPALLADIKRMLAFYREYLRWNLCHNLWHK